MALLPLERDSSRATTVHENRSDISEIVQLVSSGPISAKAAKGKAAPAQSTLGGIAEIAKVLRLTARNLLFLVWLPLRTSLRYLTRHPVHAIVISALCSIIGLLIVTGSEFHDQMILSKISDQTVDRIIHGSRFTRPYNADDVTTGGERELGRVGAPEWIQRESVRAVLFYARKAELSLEDQAVLLAIADIESGFNPIARAPSTTACGLYQFVKKTGENFGLARKDCMDPWRNAKAEIDFYLANYEKGVQKNVSGLSGAERAFKIFELSYYMHHDGPDYTTSPSNEVKATILSGTEFLFKSYHALLDEAESQKHAPSFAESFSNNLWKFVGRAADFIGYDSTRLLERFGASGPRAQNIPPDKDAA